MERATQFSVDIAVKNHLDRFKAERKEAILAHFKSRRRMITNSMAIEYAVVGFESMEQVLRRKMKEEKRGR
jgi:hypothetical protein